MSGRSSLREAVYQHVTTRVKQNLLCNTVPKWDCANAVKDQTFKDILIYVY